MTNEPSVRVTRHITASFVVPMTAYDGMTLEQIREWETENSDPGSILDDITSDVVEVEMVEP